MGPNMAVYSSSYVDSLLSNLLLIAHIALTYTSGRYVQVPLDPASTSRHSMIPVTPPNQSQGRPASSPSVALVFPSFSSVPSSDRGTTEPNSFVSTDTNASDTELRGEVLNLWEQGAARVGQSPQLQERQRYDPRNRRPGATDTEDPPPPYDPSDRAQ